MHQQNLVGEAELGFTHHEILFSAPSVSVMASWSMDNQISQEVGAG